MSDGVGEPASNGDLRTALDRMSDGFFTLDGDWRIGFANDRGREILRSAMSDDAVDPDGSVAGANLWESIPESTETVFYDQYHRAMETQEPVSFDSYYEPLDTWFEARAFPSDDGISVFLRDITERRELELRREESLRAVQRLYAVSSDYDRTFEEKVDEILTIGCEYLDVPNGFLTRIDDETQHIEASHATHPLLQSGETCPLDEAYCRRTIEREQLLTIVNASEAGWAEDPAHETFGLETYIGGRIEVDGERFGTLCFADTTARDEPFTDTQQTFVELLTRWVSYELERRRVADQIERERDRLDEFASVVSHDLRNPLTTARGRVDLLESQCDSDHVEPIERSLSRMDTLIQNILAMSRDGGGVGETTRVDLVSLAEDAWETTDARGGTLRLPSDEFDFRADEPRLRQLLENLFRNAAEHGSVGADSDGVTVTVGPLPDDEGFYVADDGPGIPEDARDEVFESGYTTTSDGTGFGLDIVSKIADGHGWEVRATESEDGGARFEFTGIDRV